MVLGEKHGTNYLPCTSFSSPCFVYNFFRKVYFFFMGSDPINSPSRYKKSWFFNVHIYSVKSAQSPHFSGDFWYPVLMFEDLPLDDFEQVLAILRLRWVFVSSIFIFRITKNSNALNRLKPIQKDPSIIYDAKILIGHLNLMTLSVRLSLNIYINNQWFMIW